MTVASRQELTSMASDYANDHECPYAEQLLTVDRQKQMGSYGINLATLSRLIDELGQLHTTDTCPPTHIGTGPTSEWAEWVKGVRV